MSLRTLEAAIRRELHLVTGNTKIRQKDIMEWQCGIPTETPLVAQEGEKLAFLPKLGVHVSYKEQA